MKKVVLEFKEREYNRALTAYKDHRKSVLDVITSAKDLGVDLTEVEVYEQESLYSYVCGRVYNVASKDATLPKSINKLKFLELLDIDLNPLSKCVNNFNRLRTYDVEPNKEHFTRYLADKDKETYNSLHKVVETLNDLADKNFIKNKLAISQAFAHIIVTDQLTTRFKLNI